MPWLSTDFDLRPELLGFSDDAAFDGTARMHLMMNRWRRGPTFGVMENKLLASTLLDVLGLSQAYARAASSVRC